MYKWLVILFISSCSFYSNEVVYNLPKEEFELLIVTGDDGSIRAFSGEVPKSIVLKKYVTYYLSLYPMFIDELSRFPKGSIIEPGESDNKPSFKIGCVTKGANEIHSKGLEVDIDSISQFICKTSEIDDPWTFDFQQLKNLLINEVAIESLRPKEGFSLELYPLLNRFYSENILQKELYCGFHRFYNPQSDEIIHLEVDDKGEVISYIRR